MSFEIRGHMFFRNVGRISAGYMALHPMGQSSCTTGWKCRQSFVAPSISTSYYRQTRSVTTNTVYEMSDLVFSVRSESYQVLYSEWKAGNQYGKVVSILK
jgi:hypothetical protein